MMNPANQVTFARFVLSMALFVLLAFVPADDPAPSPALVDTAFVLFVIAAASDLVDGYLARRCQTVSSFGRIADPFVDKILVCGTLVFLAASPQTAPILPAWVVVAILTREFVVHELRSHLEAKGQAFGAGSWGKLKMVIQCVAAGGLLFAWGWGRGKRWVEVTDHILVWLALAFTLFSGAVYALRARALLRGDSGPPDAEKNK